MSSAYTFTTLILSTCITLAHTHAIPPSSPLQQNQPIKRDAFPTWCTENQLGDFLRTVAATPTIWDFPEFCSQYRRPTEYFWVDGTTETQSATKIITTTTWPTHTNTFTGLPSTTTVLCPTPTPSTSLVCGANNYNQTRVADQIWYGDSLANTSPQDCHQFCLKSPTCKFFVVVDVGSDNLNARDWYRCVGYTNPINASAVGPQLGAREGYYAFYDRDCPNLLPAACSAPQPTTTLSSTLLPGSSHPMITFAPILPSGAILEKPQDKNTTIPDALASWWPGFFDIGCSCVITSPSATTTSAVTRPTYRYLWTTITTTRKRLHEVTEYPGWSTVVVPTT